MKREGRQHDDTPPHNAGAWESNPSVAGSQPHPVTPLMLLWDRGESKGEIATSDNDGYRILHESSKEEQEAGHENGKETKEGWRGARGMEKEERRVGEEDRWDGERE